MRNILLSFLFTLLFVGTKSQIVNYTGVQKIYVRGIQSFSENNVVKGYSCFYFLDRVSEDKSLYALSILDENLKQTHYVELTKSKGYDLLESSFNGERFCFSFLDWREKVLEYVFLDKTGKEVGNYKIEKLDKSELSSILKVTQYGQNPYSGGLISVGKIGFMRYGYENTHGVRASLEMFDNSGKIRWTSDSKNPDKKSFETAYPLYADDKFVVSLFVTKRRRLSGNYHDFITFHDPANGNELFRLNNISTDEKNVLFPSGVSFDTASNLFYVYGEYFKKGENIFVDKSSGLYLQIVSSDGKILAEKYNSWTRDISGLMAQKGAVLSNFSIAIHKLIRTADGKFFIIGEEFMKTINFFGYTKQGNGYSRPSGIQIELHDMIVFDLNDSLKVTNVNIFKKDDEYVSIPEGYGVVGNSFLAYLLKQWSKFDYVFTTVSGDKKTFNTAYVNYDRDKEEGKSFLIGNIEYTKEGKLEFDKIKLTDKPTFFMALPAKPGYMAVFKYFKKTKEIDFTLEKMNL